MLRQVDLYGELSMGLRGDIVVADGDVPGAGDDGAGQIGAGCIGGGDGEATAAFAAIPLRVEEAGGEGQGLLEAGRDEGALQYRKGLQGRGGRRPAVA